MVTPVVKKGTPSLQQAIHLAGNLNHHLSGRLHGACWVRGALPYKPIRDVPFFGVSFFSVNS